MRTLKICLTINGKRHCYYIPIYFYPLPPIPIPHPENYDYLITDATIVATIANLADKLSDTKVNEAIQGGVQSAIKSMQTHAGQGVEIQLTAAKG